MKHDKLVRDKIPEIISENGDIPITHVADSVEYWEMLKAKLLEEAQEVIEDKNIKEELADLLEVIRAIMTFKKISSADVEKARLEKYYKRGGFEGRVVLDETR